MIESVIVTGSGGTGCGRAIAERFARERAAVVVSDIDEPGGRVTVDRIRRAGGHAEFCRADVRDDADVKRLITFTEERFRRLDVLVNNASGPFRPDEPLEHWADTVQTELLGTMRATRYAIDAMRRLGGGAIVNMASISGLWHGRRTRGNSAPAYDVAKGAVIRFTSALSDLAAEGIRVNCLAPGWIATDEPRQYWESLTPAQRAERGVPSRLLAIDDVADMVFHLATDHSLTGRVVVWWSDKEPELIEWADRGYERAQPFTRRIS
jgi:NAD(P)-dependent dehydrogenase (short-subunit alcohol dehydrogenase family)